MAKKTYRRCPECGHLNLNRDYCENCGELINTNLKRKREGEERTQQKEKERDEEKPNAVTQYFKKLIRHPNPIIRYPAKVFYSVWAVVMAIGAFLAFIFSYLAF
ncbi:hypothetical protein RQM65_14510 [Pricia sp. S334]|uniref:Zinc ribbon domain-containing protein n=1 Tax=Pricia mediterranea TaxID=3076079 RepID=A0ABU3L9H1_9FLAO|nr:hypothetical protein [Pricia sp. S334]MDT7829883.1 hypothetical protein [Pricia sp. S334]